MLIFILTAVLAVLLQLILPWWSAPLAAFMVAVSFQQGAFRAFLNGFVAIFLVWSLTAAGISIYNDGVLAARLASLFSLPSGWMVIPVTGLIGGLPAGMAALTGNLIRKALKKTGEPAGTVQEDSPFDPKITSSAPIAPSTGYESSASPTDSRLKPSQETDFGADADPSSTTESDTSDGELPSKK